jgi:hypothetical protein
VNARSMLERGYAKARALSSWHDTIHAVRNGHALGKAAEELIRR